MARTYAPVYTSIWQDDDFRRLSQNAQHVYLMVISQPDVNYCGVLSVTEKRWASFTQDVTIETMAKGLAELEEKAFIVRDDDTEELLIRSFVKHNKVTSQPKLLIALKRQYNEIHSPRLRAVVFDALPVDNRQGLEKPQVDTPGVGYRIPNRIPEPLTEGIGVGNPSRVEPVSEPISSSSTRRREVLEVVVQRQLGRRVAQVGPVGDTEKWLEAARRRVPMDQVRELVRANADKSAQEIADLLEPPVKLDPVESTRAAQQKNFELEQRRRENPCPDCDRGRVIDDGVVRNCDRCNGSGVAA